MAHVLSELAGVEHLPYVSVEWRDGVCTIVNRCMECGKEMNEPRTLLDVIEEEYDDG